MMLRTLALAAVAVFMLALAPPAFAQKGGDSGGSEPSIAGTNWTSNETWSNGETHSITAQFRGDGVLVYSYDGATYQDGTWWQNGPLVSIELNNHFVAFIGLTDGASINGEMYNVNGTSGRWSFTRR